VCVCGFGKKYKANLCKKSNHSEFLLLWIISWLSRKNLHEDFYVESVYGLIILTIIVILGITFDFLPLFRCGRCQKGVVCV